MRIVDLPAEGQSTLYSQHRSRVHQDVYQGPPDEFPYVTLRGLGVTQIVLGCASIAIGVVQLAITEEDRAISLMAGAATVWAPLFAIAAGVVGVLFTRRRYWDAQCMKVAYSVASWVGVLLLGVMIVLLTTVHFFYYDLHDSKPSETYLLFDKRAPKSGDLTDYQVMPILMTAVGGLNLIICLTGALLACCGANTYTPPSRNVRTFVKPQSQLGLIEPAGVTYGQKSVTYGQPQVRTSMPPQQPIYMWSPQGIQFIPQEQAPPMQFIQQQAFMPTPAPSVVYMM